METLMEEEECSPQEDPHWNYEMDIMQLCRICANPNEYLIPIFEGEGLEHELEKKISKHLPIKVSEQDLLPTHLCYQCASTLIAWHDMVIGCVEADEKLKNVIEEIKNKTSLPDRSSGVQDSEVRQVKGNATRSSVSILNMKSQNIEAVQNKNDSLNETAEDQEIESPLVDEETTLAGSELVEEVTSDSRKLHIKQERTLDNIIILSEPKEEVVEVYEHPDVETSVVVQDIADSIDEGQYIAYIEEELIESSSVEAVNSEMDKAYESAEENKIYICEECGKAYMNLIAFQHHLATHHNNKGHVCNFCDTSYKRIDHLQKHIEIMHPESNINLTPKEKKANPYAKTFLCNTCGKILKSSIAYENHTLKHQSKCPYPCSVCSETFPNRGARRRHEVKVHNLLTKENGNPDGYHVCEKCGLEMFSDGAYYHHKDKHGEPYPCTFCGKLYGSRSLMQVHARRHTTERPFVCSICNRNFKVKQELNAHLNIHKDLRPYQCPHCPKMCRKSSDLTHHIRTHTGEKPYICDKCGRGFAQAGDMRKHRQLHFRPSKINKNLPS